MQIQVGSGVTECVGCDSYPYTVIEVKRDGKELILQRDRFWRTDNNGRSGPQEYEYVENPDAETFSITKRKNGNYKRKAGIAAYNYTLGVRDAYLSPDC